MAATSRGVDGISTTTYRGVEDRPTTGVVHRPTPMNIEIKWYFILSTQHYKCVFDLRIVTETGSVSYYVTECKIQKRFLVMAVD